MYSESSLCLDSTPHHFGIQRNYRDGPKGVQRLCNLHEGKWRLQFVQKGRCKLGKDLRRYYKFSNDCSSHERSRDFLLFGIAQIECVDEDVSV